MGKYTVTIQTGEHTTDKVGRIRFRSGNAQSSLTLSDFVELPPPNGTYTKNGIDEIEVDTTNVGEIDSVEISIGTGASKDKWSFDWIKVINHDLPDKQRAFLATNGQYTVPNLTHHFSGNFTLTATDANTASPCVLLSSTTSADVYRMLRRDWKSRLTQAASLRLADADYFYPTFEMAKEIVAASSVQSYKWQKNKFNNDDFAIELKSAFVDAARRNVFIPDAYAFGIVWSGKDDGGGNAMNWVITDDHILHFVDPQTDEFFSPTSTKGQKITDIFFSMS